MQQYHEQQVGISTSLPVMEGGCDIYDRFYTPLYFASMTLHANQPIHQQQSPKHQFLVVGMLVLPGVIGEILVMCIPQLKLQIDIQYTVKLHLNMCIHHNKVMELIDHIIQMFSKCCSLYLVKHLVN